MFKKFLLQWNYLKHQPGFQKRPITTFFRLMLWRGLCLIGKSALIWMSACGIKMYLPAEWRGVAKLIFVFRDEYESELALLKHFLIPAGVMVDVGANYGIYSLCASRVVGNSGRVIAFEPAQKTFDILKKNVTLNGASNVACVQAAISDQPGKAALYHHPDPSRNSLTKVDNLMKDYEVVEVHTLDEILSEYNVTRVDFVKIDTEGADELVCRGAQKTLKTFSPPILFEYNPPASSQMGLKPQGVLQVLAELGYTFYTWSNGELYPTSINDVTGGNILAVHSSRHIEA